MTTRLARSKEDEEQHRPNPPGSGHLHLTASSTRATFSTLLSSYPLKILSPSPLPSQPLNVASCYTLAYGGGLVAGDLVSLRVEVDQGPLSQSLKGDPNPLTRQRLHVTLAPRSFILLLPDSVSPFRGSRYSQAQRTILPSDGDASVLILDWVNSGRGQQRPAANCLNDAEEEIWAMESYNSVNEIYLSERQIMRDRMLLDTTISPLAPRMRPFNVYATILIYGPTFASLLKHLEELGDMTRQFQVHRPPEMVWSFSPVEAERGGLVRVAGVEVEDVRKWIRKTLQSGGVEHLVGQGLWPRLI